MTAPTTRTITSIVSHWGTRIASFVMGRVLPTCILRRSRARRCELVHFIGKKWQFGQLTLAGLPFVGCRTDRLPVAGYSGRSSGNAPQAPPEVSPSVGGPGALRICRGRYRAAMQLREQGMPKRRRFSQTSTLEERLAEDTERLLEKAKMLEPSPARDDVLRKIRQNETAAHVSEWLNSSGLQPPKSPA
jgi:hypothetical protein